MMVLSLCEKFCKDKIPFNISKKIGDGADGECFNLLNAPDKVIKLSVLYEYDRGNIEDQYKQNISPIIDFLITNPSTIFAKIYSHNYLGSFTRDFNGNPQSFILYYYVMEKLQKISDDEQKVFHTILSHEDRGINKKYSISDIRKILNGLKIGLDFSYKKIIDFYSEMLCCPIIHLDLHPRNIMKDNFGNFKLIDLDRCDFRK